MIEKNQRISLHGVIVTGACSGIGYACAKILAGEGRPIAIWDIDGSRAKIIAEELAHDYGVRTAGVGIDLRLTNELATAVRVTRTMIGSIGALVHAAGVTNAMSLDQLTADAWDEVIDLNLRALPFIVQAIRDDLAKIPDAAVVAIASISATLGAASIPAYTASKGGVVSLVRSLADDLAEDGIRINTVSPGLIRTPMLKPVLNVTPAGSYEQRILLGRIGEPIEVACAVRFLLSTDASYITAAELVVDGGNISSQRM